eukprot:149564-Rhodomonas_salina.1
MPLAPHPTLAAGVTLGSRESLSADLHRQRLESSSAQAGVTLGGVVRPLPCAPSRQALKPRPDACLARKVWGGGLRDVCTGHYRTAHSACVGDSGGGTRDDIAPPGCSTRRMSVPDSA